MELTNEQKEIFLDMGISEKDLRYANLSNANLSNADLRYANLSNADLRNADLSYANLSNADLRNADLSYANLSNADLSNADLSNADLSNANLSNADLRNADLSNADLRYADLRNADLRNADLRYADLRNANLSNADLNDILINENTFGITINCPEEGAFIGYKKCHNKIVTLLILEDAKRSSATTYKCRASKVKVLEIEGNLTEINSDYDLNFIYKIGEILEVHDFDENRWNECSAGIHFFMNKELARQYN